MNGFLENIHRFRSPAHDIHGDAVVAIYEDAQHEVRLTRDQKSQTFQCNSSVVSKFVRPNLDLNFGNAYVERRPPDGQYRNGVGPDEPVRNQLVSENDDTAKANGCVDVPIHMVTFLELVGLVFDTGIILEDKLENGLRTSLDKIDKYFYATILSLRNNGAKSYLPFK